MKILIAHHTKIPVTTYGGTERIMWWLGKELNKLGNKVSYLVNRGSTCPFANILEYDPQKAINNQIPDEVDLIHFFFQPNCSVNKPHLVTNQGNVPDADKLRPFDRNTVFVSKNHAERHQSNCFVYNGIDTDDYGTPNLELKREYYHFLAKASWRAKNLGGAIDIVERTNDKLHVLGGNRLNIKFKRLFNKRITFHGMIGGSKKNKILNLSKGLIFPVLWNEPFGIAIIESLYFGCPVFGTKYGSLPEIVSDEVGFLSNSEEELAKAVEEIQFSPKICQQHVIRNFTSEAMTKNYLELYEIILSGKSLNEVPPSASSTSNEKFPAGLLP